MKKEFITCTVQTILFDRTEIIETSSFDGVVDEFYDNEGNPVNQVEQGN